MKCPVCNEKILKNDNYCENCGADLRVNSPSEEKQEELSIVGFILVFFFPIVGLILSIIALNKIKKEGTKGKELAIAGIIIGSVNVGWSVISLIYSLIVVIIPLIIEIIVPFILQLILILGQ